MNFRVDATIAESLHDVNGVDTRFRCTFDEAQVAFASDHDIVRLYDVNLLSDLRHDGEERSAHPIVHRAQKLGIRSVMFGRDRDTSGLAMCSPTRVYMKDVREKGTRVVSPVDVDSARAHALVNVGQRSIEWLERRVSSDDDCTWLITRADLRGTRTTMVERRVIVGFSRPSLSMAPIYVASSHALYDPFDGSLLHTMLDE